MRTFIGGLFGKGRKLPAPQDGGEAVRGMEAQRESVELYKKGDMIGPRYQVLRTLGRGGFGIVYLVYIRDPDEVCALKTFRGELLADASAREAFKKEACLWVNLGRHPLILTAEWVEEVSGRLFVLMEWVAPDAHGRVSLADHLAGAGGPLDTNQVLTWAIQFCLGMEHARAHGVLCHRDIKPANMLITDDGTLKITDFGLAVAAEVAWRGSSRRRGSLVTGSAEGGFGFSLTQAGGKVRCGTPGYMAPEVYCHEGADIRSDIYSFGLVLWQLTVGSRVPPFMVPWRGDMEGYLRGIYDQQMALRVPRMKGPLGEVIGRCLQPKPSERYGSFEELRGVLEPMLKQRTGREFEIPQTGAGTAASWHKKGASLDALGRGEEAIECVDKALAIDPRCAAAWNSKGLSLRALVWHEEAIECYDKVLAIEPRFAYAWHNKGMALHDLGRGEEAIDCFDQALTIDPRCAAAWAVKGGALGALGRHDQAIACCDRALAIDPLDEMAWNSKGVVLQRLGRFDEAIGCCDQALAINSGDANAWNVKGLALWALGRHEEAIECFDKALAIDPRHTSTWYNKGDLLLALGQHEEAIACWDRVLAIHPRDAGAWFSKARSQDLLNNRREAMSSYRKFIELAPPQYGRQVAVARQRLRELEAKRT
jgi:tetratricopeptide (TPR) repeat protein